LVSVEYIDYFYFWKWLPKENDVFSSMMALKVV